MEVMLRLVWDDNDVHVDVRDDIRYYADRESVENVLVADDGLEVREGVAAVIWPRSTVHRLRVLGNRSHETVL